MLASADGSIVIDNVTTPGTIDISAKSILTKIQAAVAGSGSTDTALLAAIAAISVS